MQAVMAEIKTRLSALKNDSQPSEELQMRVCMTKTVELMKILRNTFVESGQYSEGVISDTSKVLGKCRHLMGLLLWNVSLNAVGGKVNEKMTLSFHQTMDVVIADLDNVIKDGPSTQKLWHADRLNEGPKELGGLIPDSLESKFSFQKTKPNELSASQKSDLTLGGNRGDGWNRNQPKETKLKLRKKNINHWRRKNPDWRAKWRLLLESWPKNSTVDHKEKPLIPLEAPLQPEKSLTSSTPESSRTDSNPSDLLIKESENQESQPGVNTENKHDLKVLWNQKDKPLTQTSSTSSKLLFKDLFQSENHDTQTASSNGSKLWLQKAESVIQASIDPDLPQSRNDGTQTSLKTESTQDPQVSWSQIEKPMIQMTSTVSDLPQSESKMSFVGAIQVDGGKTSQETKRQGDLQALCVQKDMPMTQTSSSSSDSIFKEVPRPEKIERQTSLTTEMPRDTPIVQKGSTFFDLLYKNLLQSDNDENQTRLGTESQLIHKGESMIQTIPKPSDPVINNLLQSKNDETKARLEVFLSKIDKPFVPKASKCKDLPQSKSKVSFVGPIQSYGRETRASTENLQDLEVLWDQKDKLMIQTSTSSSDLVFKDLPLTEKVRSQQSLSTESTQVRPMVKASSTSLDALITGLPQPEPKIRFVGSILKDLSARSRPKSLKEPPQPVESDIQAKATTKNVTELQLLWAEINKLKDENQKSLQMGSLKNLINMRAQIDKLMVKATSASPKPLVTPKNPVSHVPVASQQATPKRVQANPTVSFFSVGKTFGDHRKRVLQWCRDRTKIYGIPMYEFSESWRSGRALVAIIHSYHSNLIETAFLSRKPPLETITYGAIVATSLGVVGKDRFVHECLQKKPDFCVIFKFVWNLERCLVPNLNRSRF